MAKKLMVGFQLSETSQGVWRALANPDMWKAYKQKVLRIVSEGAKSTIQSYAASLWKRPTGQLDNSWFVSYDWNNYKATIYNSKHYAYWLNYGVRPHQMTYLMDTEERSYMAWGKYPYRAKAPIPIASVKDGLIFRRVTAAALAAGRWQHPGLPALEFAEKGLLEYQATRLNQELDGVIASVIKEYQ